MRVEDKKTSAKRIVKINSMLTAQREQQDDFSNESDFDSDSGNESDICDYETMNPGKRDQVSTPADDIRGRFGVYAIKKIARNNGKNLFDIQTDLTVFVPVAKALNHSRLTRTELTRLWLARLGQPSLDMVNRILRNGRATGPVDKLMSNLNECNWIQTKGNFRMKSYQTSEYGRCIPGEKPWDTIMVDGHGPHHVPSLQGAVMGYYFRSRFGGAVIVKGAKHKDQFPGLLEHL